MDKKAAISIISQAAKVYNEQLNNKNLLIIYGAPSKPSYLETRANETNFLHLTGVVLNENINGNSPDKFFQNAMDERLSEEEFRFKDNTTTQKLNVLVQTLRVASNASMIGDYNFNPRHIRLQTDKFAGSVSSCLGLFKPDESSRYYVPNSVLESDIRDEVFVAERILAIVSKKINEKEYNKIEKVAKKIDINRLFQTLKSQVPIFQNLLSSASTFISSPPDVNMFASLPSPEMGGGSAVLNPPRFSFGQSLANLINKWADKIGEGIERRKRELQIARQENDELKKELTDRDEQLAQKDEIIKELHAEKKDLTLEFIEQKRIFREATRKTLDEKFAGAKQRCRDRKTEKPPHSLEPPKGTHRR